MHEPLIPKLSQERRVVHPVSFEQSVDEHHHRCLRLSDQGLLDFLHWLSGRSLLCEAHIEFSARLFQRLDIGLEILAFALRSEVLELYRGGCDAYIDHRGAHNRLVRRQFQTLSIASKSTIQFTFHERTCSSNVTFRLRHASHAAVILVKW